jgi:hypothetical protein
MTTKTHGYNKIIHKFNVVPTAQQVIELYNNAGLPRPTHDPQRIRAMFENSDLIVTAWNENKLVGVSRSITDWSGVVSLPIWLSVPTAMDYYPKVGFARENRAFIMHGTK